MDFPLPKFFPESAQVFCQGFEMNGGDVALLLVDQVIVDAIGNRFRLESPGFMMGQEVFNRLPERCTVGADPEKVLKLVVRLGFRFEREKRLAVRPVGVEFREFLVQVPERRLEGTEAAPVVFPGISEVRPEFALPFLDAPDSAVLLEDEGEPDAIAGFCAWLRHARIYALYAQICKKMSHRKDKTTAKAAQLVRGRVILNMHSH